MPHNFLMVTPIPKVGELASSTAVAGSTNILNRVYTRDDLGRTTAVAETGTSGSKNWVYIYNPAGFLSEVRLNGVLQAEYDYDLNGNRTSVTTPSGTVSATHDAQDRLLTHGTESFTYFADGALKSRTDSSTSETTSYHFDPLGNLRSVSLPDGRVLTYLIDGMNRRVGKQVNGTLTQGFLYDGQLRIVAELDSSNTVVSRFVYTDSPNSPEYMIQGSTSYRFIKDHLGSPRFIVNTSTNAIVQTLEYNEWGMVTNDSNPGFQPFGFAVN